MIYIAGKIRNLDDYEILFNAGKKHLNKQGLKSITAVELLERINYTKLSEKDIINEINELIYDCESVYILPNWKSSKGTKFEIEIANYYNKKITYLSWTDLFDSQFLIDFQNHFNITFSTRVESKLLYKHLLIYYFRGFISSCTTLGRLIYNTKSNPHSTVTNALNHVQYVKDGFQGYELKNEYLNKLELIDKFIRRYYEV